MAHLITAQELKNVFENQFSRPRNINELFKFVERKVLAGTSYNDAINDAVALAQNRSVAASFSDPQQVLFGRKLGDYSGFSHAQLQSVFGLSPSEATEVQAILGVTDI